MKYDESGTREWTKQFGTPEGDAGRSVLVGNGGEIHIVGSLGGSLAGLPDGPQNFVASFDPSGIRTSLTALDGTSEVSIVDAVLDGETIVLTGWIGDDPVDVAVARLCEW